MHTYEKFFAEYGQIVAQVLLTRMEPLTATVTPTRATLLWNF